MRPLSANELLTIWEQGQAQPPGRRALALLTVACPEIAPDVLVKLSVGQRDTYLLTLREWTFGAHLVSLTQCPSCQERLELTTDVRDIRVPSNVERSESFTLNVGDYQVQCRLPNSEDVETVAEYPDLEKAKQHLLQRCLVEVHHHGEKAATENLPVKVGKAVVERMAALDPQADIQLALACPACHHQWQSPFDIVSYFWTEINAWAKRILLEVHTLASRYGWREMDILAMSPWRRQAYLQMVHA